MNYTNYERGRTARKHRQAQKDETHVLGNHVWSGHTVQGMCHAQFNDVRVDQHVERVTQVSDKSHDHLESAGGWWSNCDGNCDKISAR